MFAISKWCAVITDDSKDTYTNKDHTNLPYEFRLRDEDGDVYAYGYSDCNDSEKAFEPLDKYMPRYGCTIIEYKNTITNQWEVL